MRATAQDPDTAGLIGIDAKHTYALATAIAVGTVTIAGTFFGMRSSFSPLSGPTPADLRLRGGRHRRHRFAVGDAGRRDRPGCRPDDRRPDQPAGVDPRGQPRLPGRPDHPQRARRRRPGRPVDDAPSRACASSGGHAAPLLGPRHRAVDPRPVLGPDRLRARRDPEADRALDPGAHGHDVERAGRLRRPGLGRTAGVHRRRRLRHAST